MRKEEEFVCSPSSFISHCNEYLLPESKNKRALEISSNERSKGEFFQKVIVKSLHRQKKCSTKATELRPFSTPQSKT